MANHHKVSGSKGGKAALRTMTAYQRSARARYAAQWRKRGRDFPTYTLFIEDLATQAMTTKGLTGKEPINKLLIAITDALNTLGHRVLVYRKRPIAN